MQVSSELKVTALTSLGWAESWKGADEMWLTALAAHSKVHSSMVLLAKHTRTYQGAHPQKDVVLMHIRISIAHIFCMYCMYRMY